MIGKKQNHWKWTLSDTFPSGNLLSKKILQLLLCFKNRCTEETVSCSILLWLSFSTTRHSPEWQSCKTWRRCTISWVLMTSVESVRQNLWFPCWSLGTGFVLDKMATLWICLDDVWISRRSSSLPTLVCKHTNAYIWHVFMPYIKWMSPVRWHFHIQLYLWFWFGWCKNGFCMMIPMIWSYDLTYV